MWIWIWIWSYWLNISWRISWSWSRCRHGVFCCVSWTGLGAGWQYWIPGNLLPCNIEQILAFPSLAGLAPSAQILCLRAHPCSSPSPPRNTIIIITTIIISGIINTIIITPIIIMPSLVDTEMPASGSILRLTAFKTTFALAMNSDDDDHVMMWWWWWWWWSCDYIYYWKYRHGCIWARTKRGLVLISWFHSSATLSSDSTLNTKLNLSNRTIVSWCLSSTFDYKIIDQLEFF